MKIFSRTLSVLAIAAFGALGSGPATTQSAATDLRVPKDFKLDLLYSTPLAACT